VNPADLVIVNGRLKTCVPGDEDRHTAIAIKDGRIATIGNDFEIRADIGPRTTVIDAHGNTVMPGFVDAHAHWSLVAQSSAGFAVNCRTPPIHDIAEMVEAGRAAAERVPAGEWIVLQGNTFQNEKLADGRLPSKSDLDAVSTRHAVVYRTTIHQTVVNSFALQAARITKETEDPPGARIDREAVTGEPTGVLDDMYSRLPITRDTDEGLQRAVEEVAREHLLANGVTSVQDIVDSLDVFRLQGSLVKQRRLPIRLQGYVWVPLASSLDAIEELTRAIEPETDWFEVGGIKLFADGGMHQAAMHEDFVDWPGHRGSLNYDVDELATLISQADSLGVQVIVHAVGDRGQDTVLAAFERSFERTQPRSDHRHRLEHGGLTCWNAERAAWCHRLGIQPVPNLGFIYVYGEYLDRAVGPRARPIMPLKSMLEGGFQVPGSSDTSGADLELLRPIHNIWNAVTRKTHKGRCLDPEECISVDDGLAMYTRHAAFQGRYERSRGQLRVGSLGDVIALSHDIDRVPVDDLLDVTVETTIVGGIVAFAAAGADV
jgi:predicted amidohydrolase YtcJ